MTASTPIANSKTAALARVLDSIPKGYAHYAQGQCPAGKALALAKKFHERYGIGLTPAQRVTRKGQGVANALMVLYWPPEADVVDWLLLVSAGSGPVWENEQLRAVTATPRLLWLGYELIRHSSRGRAAWTWRRTKSEMADLYALLSEQMNRKHEHAVAGTLERIARQPGFAGVREQSWELCQFARQRGFRGELPHLHFVQKVGYGERVVLA